MLQFPRMQHVGKIPKNFGQNLAKIQRNSDKICKIVFKKSAKVSAIFNEKIELIVYFFTQTDPTRTFATFHFLNVYFRIFLHPDGSHENGAKECIV